LALKKSYEKYGSQKPGRAVQDGIASLHDPAASAATC
jgi:hypothetical protein